MKKIALMFFISFILFSCKKENNSFINKYQAIQGDWETQSLSYDSSGIKVIKSVPYDRLVINDNLTYKIYSNSVDAIENGTIRIISQTRHKLEIYFEPKYPDYSEYAGSHIFGISNVDLIYLSNYEMILKTIDPWVGGYYKYRELTFKR